MFPMSLKSRFAAAAMAVGAVAFAGLESATGQDAPTTRRLRAAPQWNLLLSEILALKEAHPDQAGRLQQAADLASFPSLTVSLDLVDVVSVSSLVGKAVHAPTWPQSLTDAFAGVAEALGVITEGVLGDFEQEIATFLAANPDRNVSKQRKALDAARSIVGKAAEAASASRKAYLLRKAVDKVRAAKLFPFVVKPPKGKCPDALAKGAYAYGPWAVFDFDDQTVDPYYFEANWGSARISPPRLGFPESLAIDFGYCDGRDKSIVGFECDIQSPDVGTFPLANNVGAFHRGPGFGINMTQQSSITITVLNREDGIVAGTFTFVATNGAGQGQGEFVVRIVPQ